MKEPEIITPEKNAGALVPAGKNYLARLAVKWEIEPAHIKETVKDLCMPKDATQKEFLGLMIVADKYDLDPFTGEIYAFRNKTTGKIQAIFGKNTFEKVCSRSPVYQGHEFVYVYLAGSIPTKTEYPIDARLITVGCSMWRKDHPRPVIAWAKMSEYYRPEATPWVRYPTTMLEHKAFIKAAKKLLGFGDIYDADEASQFVSYDPSVSAAAYDKEYYQRRSSGEETLVKPVSSPAIEIPDIDQTPAPQAEKRASKKSLGLLKSLAKKIDMDEDKLSELCLENYGKPFAMTGDSLSQSECSELIDRFKEGYYSKEQGPEPAELSNVTSEITVPPFPDVSSLKKAEMNSDFYDATANTRRIWLASKEAVITKARAYGWEVDKYLTKLVSDNDKQVSDDMTISNWKEAYEDLGVAELSNVTSDWR